MNYRLLILDDDPLIIDSLSEMIYRNFDNISIVSFTSYEDFIKSYNEIYYDCVITDIIFGKVNSIKVYNRISKNGKVPLVYMSGNDTRTFDVYDTPHEYFLAKPIDESRLIKAVERLMNTKQFLTFDYYKKSYYVDYNDILYLESDRRLVHIVTKNNIYQTYGKLDNYALIVPSNFIRISKSFILNRNYIKERVGGEIELVNGEKFTISRSFKRIVNDAL